MKSIIKAISSSIVAILSKIAKFFMSIPSWLVSLFKTIGSFFMICLLWVKRLLLFGWSITKSLFAKARSIRKPSWFQWNIFPKDGQPPTQSLFEIAIYLGFLCFFIFLFFDFNRIPSTRIIIEADKLERSRQVNIVKYKDDLTKISLYYQIADLEVNLPMSSFREYDYNKCELVVQARTDSIYIGDSIRLEDNDYYCIPIQNPNISPYWKVIAHQIYDREGVEMYNIYPTIEEYDSEMLNYYNLALSANFSEYAENQSDSMTYNSLGDDEYIKTKQFFPNYINILKKLMPDNISNKYVYPFRSKFAYWSSYTSNDYKKMDTIWHFNQKKYIYNIPNFDCPIRNVYEASKEGLEEISDSYYLSKEVLSSLHCEPLSFYNYDYTDTISFDNSIRNFDNSIAKPGYFERFDVSQGWYTFIFHSSTLDSISLTINFSGATDFYPMGVVPDEIGSNYIKYTNQKKILIIRDNGLTFYAKFKELENLQTVRTFFVTAIISGLLIIVLSFFILGLYRTLKVFGNYLFKNRNLQ